MTKIDQTFIEFHPDSWEQAKGVASNCSGWIFRGQSKAEYRLETSLERAARIHEVRSEDIYKYENIILRNFIRRAHHFIAAPPDDSEIMEWLSIIQHYGGPTRLLDFTYSFYIACFFALQGAEKEAAVWCINLSKLDKNVRAMESITLNNLKNKPNVDLNDSAACRDALAGELTENMAVPFEPFRMNERLAIQQGLFVYPYNVSKAFENNLFSTMFNIDDLKVSVAGVDMAHMKLGTFPKHGRVLKIILTKGLHSEIGRDLLRMNINASSLFPGLDGFAKSLDSCFFTKIQ